jgi:hypothetical protein
MLIRIFEWLSKRLDIQKKIDQSLLSRDQAIKTIADELDNQAKKIDRIALDFYSNTNIKKTEPDKETIVAPEMKYAPHGDV